MNIDEINISFNYRFQSGLGPYEHGRFVRDVVLEIIATDDSGDEIEKIGKINFLVIYVDQAYDSKLSFYDILDAHSEYLARHIFKIIDSKTRNFFDKIQEFYHFDIYGSNLCLIEKITVLPKYRGYKIGAKAIKDLVFHYASGCGLFALQAFPLQLEPSDFGDKYKNLELDKFEKSDKKAIKKLKAYYNNVGFHEIKGIKDLMFYNPALKNEAFDNLDLEANPFD